MLDEAPLFCAKCATQLTPGSGSFYQVTIEACADATALVVTENELDAAAIRQRLNELYAELRNVSAQEAMDQVYRHLTLHLCAACFRVWIENPVR